MFASDARSEGTSPSETLLSAQETAGKETVDELTFRYEVDQLAPNTGLSAGLFQKTLPLPQDQQPGEQLGAFIASHRWTFASLAAHALMLTCFALMPPKSSALAMDMLNEDTQYARYLATPVEIEPEEDPFELPDLNAGGEPAKATKGEAGQIGSDKARKAATRGGVGTKGAPPPSDARAEAATAGILGVLASGGLAPQTDLPFTQDNKFGYGEDAALGVLLGAQLGDNAGFNGLAMRGTGRSGGGDGDGTVALGSLGGGLGDRGTGGSNGRGPGNGVGIMGGRKSRVPNAGTCPTCKTEIMGGMSKETIRRTIQRHMNEIRYCYEEGLRSQPDLGGRVQVSFMISPAGVVTQASIADSSLHNAQVETCVANAARRWTFPAPEGGGYVAVRYPFLLEQAGQ